MIYNLIPLLYFGCHSQPSQIKHFGHAIVILLFGVYKPVHSSKAYPDKALFLRHVVQHLPLLWLWFV